MSQNFKLPKIINNSDKNRNLNLNNENILSLPNIKNLNIPRRSNVTIKIATYEDIKRYLDSIKKN
jgi:hypothetical protein